MPNVPSNAARYRVVAALARRIAEGTSSPALFRQLMAHAAYFEMLADTEPEGGSADS
jgi:hypothetical protein